MGVLEQRPLRFPNEFVRHKTVDVVGDLALTGRRIQAHIVADQAGASWQRSACP